MPDKATTKILNEMNGKIDLLIELVSDLYQDRVNLARQSDLAEIRADLKIIKLAVSDTNNEVKHHTKQIFKLNRKVFT